MAESRRAVLRGPTPRAGRPGAHGRRVGALVVEVDHGVRGLEPEVGLGGDGPPVVGAFTTWWSVISSRRAEPPGAEEHQGVAVEEHGLAGL